MPVTTAPDPCLCELRISGFELRVCHHSVTVENDRSWASVRHSTQDHFQVSYPWASFFSVLSLSRACQWCPPSMASLTLLIAEVPGSFRWPPAQDPLATSLLDLPHPLGNHYAEGKLWGTVHRMSSVLSLAMVLTSKQRQNEAQPLPYLRSCPVLGLSCLLRHGSPASPSSVLWRS